MLRLDAVIVTHALAVVLTLPVHGGEPYWLIIGGQRIQVQLEKIEPDVPPPPSDRDGDGIPDATDACPDDATNKCNEPLPDPDPLPPIDDGLDYYDALIGHNAVIYADTLCHGTDPEWYGKHKRGGGTVEVHPTAKYDSTHDAMRLDIPEYASKLGTGVDCFWPGVGPQDETTLVVKYRVRISKAMAQTGYKYKFVNLLRDGEKIGIELRTYHGNPDTGDLRTLWDVRSYLGGAESVDGRTIPICAPHPDTNYDQHPGPDSSWPYKGEATHWLDPEKWYVVTSEVSWRDGRIAYRQWFEDGKTPPVLGVASPSDPALGFLLGNSTAAITGIYFELDQSSSAITYLEPQPLRSVWFKDLVVLRGVKGEETLGQLTEGGE